MRKILTLIVPLIALAAGLAAGDMLRPNTAADEAAAQDPGADPDARNHLGEVYADAWFTFPNQFFVPMMRNGDLNAMMVLTLTLETNDRSLQAMGQQEHRLRDALLRQLIMHANAGGFDGNFTTEASLAILRRKLLETARDATDLPVNAILIEDIARQSG
ncbi:hypothetical protein JJJ17_10640 [Paracoccus caeni]|uniref:Flagellar basal body-associated protein FliL n=1 Tax=Paracoccus caeni TaxID=657651 RepID=A0A934SJB0_9RHOB|nr:hypothetical protein [Paracoccus caeni]MBK4216382.1 hypothetical protein [Paracoccus caeni]